MKRSGLKLGCRTQLRSKRGRPNPGQILAVIRTQFWLNSVWVIATESTFRITA